uniref:Uncharacterized protein n=1 Tax=Chromera velia CCMP2878 TaxID=1169474 RepID=A0A0G4F7C6_9ALVE|eukprot:Cvel_15406.t1-p1 / transcript=Cvel_15406.t1 / gene=Cvel_15406 / organism=Chromera_velia_CCMP2878 / gene_product=hypothetical protein / transcript_product=hypothetical protein / location=Cvel_scaffold1138:7717-10199(+) / protein_length=222 / sequence_SO=supercontig / SO=protein_coding / is_pseudo=false
MPNHTVDSGNKRESSKIPSPPLPNDWDSRRVSALGGKGGDDSGEGKANALKYRQKDREKVLKHYNNHSLCRENTKVPSTYIEEYGTKTARQEPIHLRDTGRGAEEAMILSVPGKDPASQLAHVTFVGSGRIRSSSCYLLIDVDLSGCVQVNETTKWNVGRCVVSPLWIATTIAMLVVLFFAIYRLFKFGKQVQKQRLLKASMETPIDLNMKVPIQKPAAEYD